MFREREFDLDPEMFREREFELGPVKFSEREFDLGPEMFRDHGARTLDIQLYLDLQLHFSQT